jgi:hypothetical protein
MAPRRPIQPRDFGVNQRQPWTGAAKSAMMMFTGELADNWTGKKIFDRKISDHWIILFL